MPDDYNYGYDLEDDDDITIGDDDETLDDYDDFDNDEHVDHYEDLNNDSNSTVANDADRYWATSYFIPPGINNAKTVHSLQIINDNEDLMKYFTSSEPDESIGRNTWDNFRLIPSSRPVINPPEFRSSFIEIPGADGLLDTSTFISSGYPLYGRRKGDVEFYVTRDYDNYYTWSKVYTNVMSFLHGQLVKCILMDDPSFYYRGRMTVNQWRSEKDWSKIVLSYDFEPYKYAVFSTANRWLWDPFDFVDGVITNPEDYFGSDGKSGFALSKDQKKTFYITAGSMRFSPSIVIFNNHDKDSIITFKLTLFKKVNTEYEWSAITLPNNGKFSIEMKKKLTTGPRRVTTVPYFVNVKNGTYKLELTVTSWSDDNGSVFGSGNSINIGLLYRYGSL